MRHIAFRALSAFAVMAAASPVRADPMFIATDLGRVIASGLNDAGQVVGQGLSAADGAPPGPVSGTGGFLYDSYGPNAGTMYAFTNFQPNSINASGQMAGVANVGNNGVFSYGTASGQVTPVVTGYVTEPGMSHINASGQTLIDPQAPGTYLTQTFIDNQDGSRIALGTPANQPEFVGTAINDRGQAVGFTRMGTTDQGYLFSGGAFHNLGTLPGASYSMPIAINNAGQIVGDSGPAAGGQSQGFLYSNGTMQALPTLGGTTTTPYGISSTGEVYGVSTTANGSLHAFLYVNGQMLDLTNMLHSLTGPISQSQDYYVKGINDKGQILVSTTDHTFLLTPAGQPVPAAPSSVKAVTVTVGPFATTPEPSALAPFVLAAVGCGARRGVGRIRAFVSGTTTAPSSGS